MVNSVSYPGPAVPDMAPKVGAGTSGGAPVPQVIPTQKIDVAPVAPEPQPVAVKAPVQQAAQPLVSLPPLAPPLTSLAIYKDPATGMQVSVIRDRISGEVVEQVPTERAVRLAAMFQQQQAVARELHMPVGDTPHVDMKT